MNVTEAKDVQRLLAWLLGEDVPDDVVKHRVFHLAERARMALSTGPTGAEVTALWRHRRPVIIHDTTDTPAPELKVVRVKGTPDA